MTAALQALRPSAAETPAGLAGPASAATDAPLPRPSVLLPTCQRLLEGHVFHAVGRKYVEAVRLAGCLPLLTPATEADALDELVSLADGLLLTGSPSNVHPRHFGEDVMDDSLPLDPDRDALTLALIPRAIAQGVPVFAICRGAQELNVALGGSLHQAVHQVPGLRDHREDESLPVEQQYGTLAHGVQVHPGGVLEQVLGLREFQVNSLHGQGVRSLGPGLRVEATAPDGLIEAFSLPSAGAMTLGVQWHPEWLAASNQVSLRLFAAFGQACRQRQQRRLGLLAGRA
ncbi:MAG: gamma-glutamyl-gamma-aminobutyrate hydrolase family protein [Burkholderiales bacterium]|nr:gamma-glutamyl-gamma-aminobutyrate hydrolase family protein [Burkholderiales bacterium]